MKIPCGCLFYKSFNRREFVIFGLADLYFKQLNFKIRS
ncbi:hypothetical protein TPE_2391 [Treponema pedis str. T A4]|uniref:Uncharacterized protein n=1 Tax=Treponema pedis str. T A4 TaxID=1291379 RepID=S5ZWS6_9SPIR|nr:hypothetical protein TPE_2391 [Treponema pedis str. T A4]